MFSFTINFERLGSDFKGNVKMSVQYQEKKWLMIVITNRIAHHFSSRYGQSAMKNQNQEF